MENIQQQLGLRNICTPIDASQVYCSVVLSLNRDESLSEQDLKTFSNNLDVNQHSRKSGRNLRVFVINIRNQPLMPTNSKIARHLLQQHKARVVKCNPFTIQLLTATGETRQLVTLKIDSGYKNVGFSAVTTKKELISGELELENKMSKRLTERTMYRRLKRNKLWYREPRFNNRVRANDLAPSIQHKLDTHTHLVDRIKSLLPISKTIVEVASFDQQKIMNPEISGIEYQQGTLQGYEIREYLLEKYHRTCQYCKKTNVPLEVEHIISKARGGSNRVSNLTIACHPCNQKKDKMSAEEFGHPEIQKQALQSLKSTAFMNIVRKRLATQLEAESTYGYITKHNRIKQGLSKTHYNDAFSIGVISNAIRCQPIFMRQKRHNNRAIQLNRNGFAPSIRKQRYAIQPHDLVWIEGKSYETKGTHCKGSRIIISDGRSINIKNIEKHYKNNSAYFIKKSEDRQFLTEINLCVSLPEAI